jgi:hypothetical protein
MNILEIGTRPLTPGPLGFRGVDRGGQTLRADTQIFYVNSAHANASDLNEGISADAPFATVQAAVINANLHSYDTIFVGGPVAESVVTLDYNLGANYVSLIGAGDSMYSPYWETDNAALPCLDLRAVGWKVSGFRFWGPTTAACIQLRHTDTNADDIAIRTVIEGNLFDGLTTGRYGIVTHGCYDVWIKDNVFQLFHNAVAGGAVPLLVGTTPLAIPYRNHVIGNVFWDNDNGAIFPCNGSRVEGNLFQKTGYAYTMAQVLQTSVGGNPGDDNIVTKNVFQGDYSIAGGFTAGAADYWMQNISDDLAEAEVDADTGFTIARPS